MAFGGDRSLKLREGLSLGVPHNEEQLLRVLTEIGVDIESISEDEIRVLCPFHGNSDTSAMSVSNPEGLFYCFNPSCDETGNLLVMVREVKQCGYLQAVQIIDGANKSDSFMVSLTTKRQKPPLVVPPETVARWHEDFLSNREAVEYIHSRGINDESIEHFKLGYSAPQNLLVTPMYDTEGVCVGGIGRGIREKVFKNIPGTRTTESLFNINNFE